MLHIPGLFVTFSEGRGRGVFTAIDLEPDDVIEVCPFILIPKEQVPTIHTTILHDYYFLLPDESGEACIPLGYGGLYNHQNQPNAKIVFDLDNQTLEVHAIENIAAGEEIFIDYTGGFKEETKLWFDAI